MCSLRPHLQILYTLPKSIPLPSSNYSFMVLPLLPKPFLSKPLLPKVNFAQGDHCPRRPLPKCNFAQVDFCPSAPIAQVPLLPKCLYCPSNLIAQVLFSCIIAQVNTNWSKISLKEQQNMLSLNKSIKIYRTCKVV